VKIYYINNCFKWDAVTEEWLEYYIHYYNLSDLVFSHSKTIKNEKCRIYTYKDSYILFPERPEFEVPGIVVDNTSYPNNQVLERKREYKLLGLDVKIGKLSFLDKIRKIIKEIGHEISSNM
jgi:hypothetical protein